MNIISYQISPLGKHANIYKGGRSYVHGTDIIPAIEKIAGETSERLFLSKISFHRPLINEGLLLVGTNLIDTVDKEQVSGSGKLISQNGLEKDFLLIDSPIPIVDFRPFNEDKLYCEFGKQENVENTLVKLNETFTLMEHISIGMKRFCEYLAPQHSRWWFANFEKQQKLPESFQELKIVRKRITLGRFISASILVDGTELGQCDFVGSEK